MTHDDDIDIDPVNSDALRAGAWGFFVGDTSRPCATLDELRMEIAADLTTTQWQTTLQTLMRLPAWIPAPQSLKDEAAAYLEGI